jgi:hypothetical protein
MLIPKNSTHSHLLDHQANSTRSQCANPFVATCYVIIHPVRGRNHDPIIAILRNRRRELADERGPGAAETAKRNKKAKSTNLKQKVGFACFATDLQL